MAKEVTIDLRNKAGEMYLCAFVLYLYIEKVNSVAEIAEKTRLSEFKVDSLIKKYKGHECPEIKYFIWKHINSNSDWYIYLDESPEIFWRKVQEMYMDSLSLVQKTVYKIKNFFKRN